MQVADKKRESCFNVQNQAMLDFLGIRENAVRYLYAHQIDAVIRVRKQFLNAKPDSNPSDELNTALVVLPTGCGKTGVAVLSAYALNASRVLVITPSVKISQQIHEAFQGSHCKQRPCFLRERGIITEAEVESKELLLPRSSCIAKAAVEIMDHLEDDVMVVNAHKIGGQSKVAIQDIPKDKYDLVIVDEAHHYPAPTWKNLVDHFEHSKRLFLTATPKHRGTPLPFSACYEMSWQQAVAEGIIRELEFDENVDTSGNPLNDVAVFMVRACYSR